MLKEWSTQDYREGDENAIAELFNIVFNKPLSLARWRWQYRDNHAGLITIALAKGKNDQLAGQYAVRPVRMKFGNKIRLGTLSLDTMTHPEYRGQGIFVKLASYLYSDLSNRGIPVTYGFPNKASYLGFIKGLQWVDLSSPFPLYIRPLKFSRVVAARVHNKAAASLLGRWASVGYHLISGRRRPTLPAGYRLMSADSFDERIDILWEKTSDLAPIMVIRDRQYLNWRYHENPTETYAIFLAERSDAIHGYIVLKKVDRFGLRVGFIVDLLAVQDIPQISLGLVGSAVDYFTDAGMDIVGCLMFPHAYYAKALRANGFFRARERMFPQDIHLGVRSNTSEFPVNYVSDPTHWYITFGDHDAI